MSKTLPNEKTIKKEDIPLTQEETTNVEARYQLIKQYQYLIHTINQDVSLYINETVCKRVGMKDGDSYELSKDNKKITVTYAQSTGK